MEVSNQVLAGKFTAYETKEEFFSSLVTYLAKALDVTHILIGYLTDDGHHVRTVALYKKGSIAENIQYALKGSVCENVVRDAFCAYTNNIQSIFPEDKKLAAWDIESYAGYPLFDSKGKPLGLMVAMHNNPIHDFEFIESIFRIVGLRVETELESFLKKKREKEVEEKPKAKSVLELLLETSKTIASEVELEKVVQKITDVATELSGAQFGAFFYNVENEEGERYLLYTISGVPKEKFSKFPMPRNTKIFGPTFAGYGTIRYDDVTQQKHFGKNAPHYGMPQGHLPVKSYLAVPVTSLSTKEVIGGLFFGHPQPGIFTEEVEKIVEGIAAQGATAMENARLFEQQKKAEQKLRRSESKFRQLSEANVIGVLFWKVDGEIVDANDAFLDFLGYTREDLEAGRLNWRKLTLPEHQENHTKGIQRALEGEVVIPYETSYVHKNGEVLPALVGYSMLEDCEDQGIAFVLDITKQREIEKALVEARKKLEIALNAASIATWTLDIKKNIVFADQNFAKFFHADPEIVTKGVPSNFFASTVHPEDRERVKKLVEETIATGNHFETEYRLSGPDHTYKWVLARGQVEYDANKRPLYFAGSLLDIHERKLAEEALAEQKETLRLTVEATGLGTWDFNPSTGTLLWSDRCKALFGLPPDAFVDYNVFLQRLHPDDRERVDGVVQWALNPESGGKYDIEYRTIGTERWIKASGEAFFNEEGQAVRFIGTVLDITEQKLRQQELTEKTRALEFANEDLKNFTYTISHDIKNPLSSLLFAASVSEDFDTLEEFREIVPLIGKSSKKINDILNGLVEIIKEEETKGKVELIDITEVIEEVKNELTEAITESNCKIITTIQKKEILFIRSYLQSVLRNLIDNAIKYRSSERPPEISISVQSNNQCTEFKVTDNGMGIDLKKHKNNLFQPFKRCNEDQPGTGIGLFMIKRIVEKYGGKVSIESQPGEGTTFYISIASINPVSVDYQPYQDPDKSQPGF